jgi:tetratricopeptide (TPR) repeat protein
LGLDPTYFDALKQLARDYAAQKDYRAADSALQRALQNSPGKTDDAEVLAQRGTVYEAAGQPHQALAAYSEALTRDPDNLQAQSGFARLQSY